MIHSLAGGNLRDDEIKDLALIQFQDDNNKYWYYFENIKLKIDDEVLAPIGPLDELSVARVLRVQHNVKSSNFAISFKKLKKICKKYKNMW